MPRFPLAGRIRKLLGQDSLAEAEKSIEGAKAEVDLLLDGDFAAGAKIAVEAVADKELRAGVKDVTTSVSRLLVTQVDEAAAQAAQAAREAQSKAQEQGARDRAVTRELAAKRWDARVQEAAQKQGEAVQWPKAAAVTEQEAAAAAAAAAEAAQRLDWRRRNEASARERNNWLERLQWKLEKRSAARAIVKERRLLEKANAKEERARAKEERRRVRAKAREERRAARQRGGGRSWWGAWGSKAEVEEEAEPEGIEEEEEEEDDDEEGAAAAALEDLAEEAAVVKEAAAAVSRAVVDVGAFAVDTVLSYAAAVADEAAAQQTSGTRQREELLRLTARAVSLRDQIRTTVADEKREAERRERRERLVLCERELQLLGLSLADADQIDERGLRRALRNASKSLHPDALLASGTKRARPYDGPTIYTLNEAYETLQIML